MIDNEALSEIYLANNNYFILKSTVHKALQRFPHVFDFSFAEGLERLRANTSRSFFARCSSQHLRRLVCIQYSLQKKIEVSLQKDFHAKHMFLKLFFKKSILCVAFTFSLTHEEEYFGHKGLIETIQTLFAGIKEVPHAFYSWIHPELPYLFCYQEVQKLRGKEFVPKDIPQIERLLKEHMMQAILPRTPATFYPVNEENSFKFLSILHKEICSEKTLPQVTIHFQHQSHAGLEFLIHLMYVKNSPSLQEKIKTLPDQIHFTPHFSHIYTQPFPIEGWVFTLSIPPHLFQDNGVIHLLYARRFVARYIEQLVGPFRDFNGGLFETQQKQFATYEARLSSTIPYFSLFAHKVFFTLKPIEKRLSLTLEEAYQLFHTIALLMQSNEFFAIRRPTQHMLVVKSQNRVTAQALSDCAEKPLHGEVVLSGFHYFYVSGAPEVDLDKLEASFAPVPPLKKTALYLAMYAEEPPSLNPFHTSREMRGRILSKLLYEGLTRIDEDGEPKLAGAEHFQISEDGRSYTFKLRSHYWSNGEKVTAFHYVQSWRHSLSDNLHTRLPELFFVIKNGKAIKEGKCSLEKLGIHAADENTLCIQLEWPDPGFLYKLSQPPFFPFFERLREPKWFNGPYLVYERTKNGLTLIANPFFWNSFQLHLKKIHFQWNSGKIQEIYPLFLEGKIDWMGEPTFPFSRKECDVLMPNQETFIRATNRFFLVYLNQQNPILASKWIRKALNAAIDREQLCASVFPYHLSMLSPFFDVPTAYNLGHAKAYFKKGLQELNLTKEAFPPLILSHSNDNTRVNVAHFLKETWEQAFDLSIDLKMIKWDALRLCLDTNQFQLCLAVESLIYNDPVEFFARFGSLKGNRSCYSNSTKTNKFICANVPFIPLCPYPHLYFHPPNLKGYIFDRSGCVDFHKVYFN